MFKRRTLRNRVREILSGRVPTDQDLERIRGEVDRLGFRPEHGDEEIHRHLDSTMQAIVKQIRSLRRLSPETEATLKVLSGHLDKTPFSEEDAGRFKLLWRIHNDPDHKAEPSAFEKANAEISIRVLEALEEDEERLYLAGVCWYRTAFPGEPDHDQSGMSTFDLGSAMVAERAKGVLCLTSRRLVFQGFRSGRKRPPGITPVQTQFRVENMIVDPHHHTENVIVINRKGAADPRCHYFVFESGDAEVAFAYLSKMAEVADW